MPLRFVVLVLCAAQLVLPALSGGQAGTPSPFASYSMQVALEVRVDNARFRGGVKGR